MATPYKRVEREYDSDAFIPSVREGVQAVPLSFRATAPKTIHDEKNLFERQSELKLPYSVQTHNHLEQYMTHAANDQHQQYLLHKGIYKEQAQEFSSDPRFESGDTPFKRKVLDYNPYFNADAYRVLGQRERKDPEPIQKAYLSRRPVVYTSSQTNTFPDRPNLKRDVFELTANAKPSTYISQRPVTGEFEYTLPAKRDYLFELKGNAVPQVRMMADRPSFVDEDIRRQQIEMLYHPREFLVRRALPQSTEHGPVDADVRRAPNPNVSMQSLAQTATKTPYHIPENVEDRSLERAAPAQETSMYVPRNMFYSAASAPFRRDRMVIDPTLPASRPTTVNARPLAHMPRADEVAIREYAANL